MSPANDIAPELISIIISYLLVPDNSPTKTSKPPKPASIAKYAAVSKEWQRSVERYTFEKLQLNPAVLEEFDRIVHGQHRTHVRHIDLDVVLDPWEATGEKYESEEVQAQNNQTFTQTFRKFFQIMGPWDSGHVPRPGITLSIKVYSPSDEKPFQDLLAGLEWLGDLCRRLERSYLQFVFPENEDGEGHILDSVSVIKSIHIASNRRKIWPATCSTIVSRLPQLESFDARLFDNEKQDQELRKRARHEFANSIPTWSPSIQKVLLCYHNEPPQDESFMPPNILTGPNDEDIFSMNLGRLSQQLRELRLDDITLGAEFFWSSSSDIDPPHWPHLTSLVINYNSITPAGQWLFERDPSEPIEEVDWSEDSSVDMEDALPEDRRYDRFRHQPIPEPMNALYTAVGKAALCMPVLRDIWMAAGTPNYLSHIFQYHATLTNACARWNSTPEFTPDANVLDIWREVSKKNVGVELDIKY